MRRSIALSAALTVLATTAAPLAAAAPARRGEPIVLTPADPQPRDDFGAFVAAVPDTDGDGLTDVIVQTAGNFPFGDPDAPIDHASLFSGASGELLLTLYNPEGDAPGSWFGSPVGVPDLDGDGRGDILVGGGTSVGTESRGLVYVFSGVNGDFLRILRPPPGEEHQTFGWALSGVPDVDGDGRGDVLVGARDAGTRPKGRAYVYSGATGALLHRFAASEKGSFGRRVAGTPDLNGDGRGDLVISADNESMGGEPSVGRVYVRSGRTGRLLHVLTPPNNDRRENFGYYMADVPDADGDGVTDIAAGTFTDIETPVYGTIYLHSGATGDLIRQVTRVYVYGSLDGVHDVDGDGLGDIVTGSALVDELHVSTASRDRIYEPARYQGTHFGNSVAGLGDLDGDGLGDIVIGAPAMNTVHGEGAGTALIFRSGDGAGLGGDD